MQPIPTIKLSALHVRIKTQTYQQMRNTHRQRTTHRMNTYDDRKGLLASYQEEKSADYVTIEMDQIGHSTGLPPRWIDVLEEVNEDMATIARKSKT